MTSLLLILLGLFWHLSSNDSAISEDPSKGDIQKDIQYNADKKKELIENKNNRSIQNNPAQTSVDVSARQESNKSVTILSKIKGSTGNNNCKLSVSNNSKVVNQEADVIYQTEFSSCAGFNIPIDRLGTGVWLINLVVGDKSSSITIEVK